MAISDWCLLNHLTKRRMNSEPTPCDICEVELVIYFFSRPYSAPRLFFEGRS